MTKKRCGFAGIGDLKRMIGSGSTLLVLVVCIFAKLGWAGEAQLQMVREIKLQKMAPQGSYGGGFMLAGTPTEKLFSTRLAPDQSLLILNPDVSGEWPLVRVRNWWTEAPSIEVLKVPGWDREDSTHMGATFVDLQISSDGHYAVAFAGANWLQKSDFTLYIPGLPKVARKPDTMISVVDLEQWRIVSSMHTAKLEDAEFRGARILGKWIALESFAVSSSPQGSSSPQWGFSRRIRLISIPELKPGPECGSQITAPEEPKPESPAAEVPKWQNGASCEDVLREAGIDSVNELESVIQMGHSIEPRSLRLRSLDFSETPGLHSDAERLAEAERRERQRYFDSWNLSRDHIYSENPPWEAPSHAWYGLYDSHEGHYYELDKFDAEGEKQKGRTARTLLCGDRNVQGPRPKCGCRVDEVAEEQRAVLIYCRTEYSYIDDSWERQWLAVFRSDDLSGVGFVKLSKDKETTETLAVRDGRTYVLVVERGKTVRVYEVPRVE
jgi:hypothetical protein